ALPPPSSSTTASCRPEPLQSGHMLSRWLPLVDSPSPGSSSPPCSSVPTPPQVSHGTPSLLSSALPAGSSPPSVSCATTVPFGRSSARSSPTSSASASASSSASTWPDPSHMSQTSPSTMPDPPHASHSSIARTACSSTPTSFSGSSSS